MLDEFKNYHVPGDAWVYVRKNGRFGYHVGLCFDERHAKDIEEMEGKILMVRQFCDTMGAIGYQLLITRMSNREMRKFIKQFNRRKEIRDRYIQIREKIIQNRK